MPRRPRVPSVLAEPFRGFFLGRVISLLGSAMAPVALALAVLEASGRPGDLGIVLAAQMVPNLLLLLVGGVVGDRFSRRAVLVVSNLGAGLTQALVAVVLLTGHYDLALVAALEVANGAAAAFTFPALRGIAPELVVAADLQRATSLLSSARNGTRVLGPTVAGLLVAGVGGGWAIALDALSYVVAAVLLSRLRLTARVPAERQRLVGELAEGWREFWGLRWVATTTLAFTVINLVNAGTWQVLGPSLTSQRFGEATWGLVLSVRAVGLLVMSVVAYHLVLRRPLRTGQLIGAVGALSMLGLGLGFAPPWFMAAAFVAALGVTLNDVTWETSFQQHVRPAALSRVSSVSDLLSFAAIPVGQLLVGPAAQRWGGATVATWCGVVYLVACLAPLLVREVRDLPGRPPVRPEESSG